MSDEWPKHKWRCHRCGWLQFTPFDKDAEERLAMISCRFCGATVFINVKEAYERFLEWVKQYD